MRGRHWTAAVVIPLAGALAVVPTAAQGNDDAGTSGRHQTGNMIFIHPDGSDVALWELARIYWHGPDSVSNWDQLDVAVPYRGHAADVLTTSSNGGATTHAFGVKVDAPDSFGTDSGAADVLAGDATEPRTIDALSGYAGSWLREAGNAGLPIGVVNDGDVAEPGTAAFLTEVTERTDASALEIARQLIQGRPGFDDDDADPAVIMGGGEDLFFPVGTPVCTQEDIDEATAGDGNPVATIPLDCVVHRAPGDTLDDDGPSATGGLRTDGVDLAQAAADEGYLVIRTRAEFEALTDAIDSGAVDPAETKVLALFASQDVFNAVAEEELIDAGLVDDGVPAGAKETNLVLYGSEPGTPGHQPPTAPEMAEVATTILDAHSEQAGKPFAAVWEVEGTDNMSNIDNAPGTLLEARYADEMIGVARDFLDRDPATTILTAADGTAGGIQAQTYDVDEEVPATVESIDLNPGEELLTDAEEPAVPQNPLDGRYGRGTEPFLSEPDQFGQRLPFAVAWTSTADLTGGVVTRAEGLHADVVGEALSARFDNVDVYRVAYLTLFGEALAYPDGQVAPTRPAPQGTEPGRPDPEVVVDALTAGEDGRG
ncbi:alkaline phosphatase [Geodermatophilus bullaregiensis]|uniref:alkaline phosphatase n=1 Tax=Geodermatophilus bullaregiensis TaxID=1564160 RepID=UPI00195D3245|nr:alkaline phosphatase [Geodermatophilus bullaregiensis]MBM7804451.1 alkaline phosphatase [Geodermatophilus bullaregiensis]